MSRRTKGKYSLCKRMAGSTRCFWLACEGIQWAPVSPYVCVCSSSYSLSTYLSVISVCPSQAMSQFKYLILGNVLRKNNRTMSELEGISEVPLRVLRQMTPQVCDETKLELVSSAPSPGLSSTLSCFSLDSICHLTPLLMKSKKCNTRWEVSFLVLLRID